MLGNSVFSYLSGFCFASNVANFDVVLICALICFSSDDVGDQIGSRDVLEIRAHGRIGGSSPRKGNAQEEDIGGTQRRWFVGDSAPTSRNSVKPLRYHTKQKYCKYLFIVYK